jgi:1-acyl-sn-glycerol-3-phosphate acyltransferase
MAASDDMVLAMAPEGTRSKVTEWKTGFYRMAHTAGVPILAAGIDFPSRTVTLLDLFHPTGDVKGDIADLQSQMQRFTGRHPERHG